jgi:hypothetical protein
LGFVTKCAEAKKWRLPRSDIIAAINKKKARDGETVREIRLDRKIEREELS